MTVDETGCLALQSGEEVTGIINKPPICEVCGKPMQPEVFPADWNLDGTGLTQCVGWSCVDCYDPIKSL